MKKHLTLFLLILSSLCFSQASAACNWKSRNFTFTTYDSCNRNAQKASIGGYVYFNSNLMGCFKYQWKVNGNAVSSKNVFTYALSQNGSYTITCKVTDTCNNCDTTFTSSKTISCFPTCNWYKRNMYFSAWDSCNGKKYKTSINGYIAGQGCFKYSWLVNGVKVSDSRFFNYPTKQNGTYNLCMKVLDTCNNCDTSYCKTFNVTCISNCNWKNRNAYYFTWDTCGLKTQYGSVNGYINFQNTNTSCFKYAWSVNNVAVKGNNNVMNWPIHQNGTYVIKCTVIDTCNNCDTTYTGTKTIGCFNTCKWYNKQISFAGWDSCNGKKFKNSINGYVYIGTQGCYKYNWLVNGVSISDSRSLNYQVTKNGTYTMCMRIIDTCGFCDTTLCRNFTVNCIPTCNWKARYPTLYTADSCNSNTKKASVFGYISFNSSRTCFKYQWTVNGVNAGNNYYMSYPVSLNGSYAVCVKVTDTCNKCDTTFCSTKTITCLPGCSWSKRNMYFSAWDSCTGKKIKYSVNGYIGPYNGCYKYNWLVNGVKVSDSRFLNYQIKQNGTYTLCMKVVDTCDKCDTTYCKTFNFTCIPGCNWKNRKPYTFSWDTCQGYGLINSVNGYISFQANSSCYKYNWTVNGKNAGNSYWVNYPITQNGTYYLCVKVTDTCNRCDTTFCMSKTISCFKNCNWSNKITAKNYIDSCNGRRYKMSLNGYVAINQNYLNCCKFLWTVDGKTVSNTYYFHAPVSKNGYYDVCVKITDTCNKCDTTICETRQMNCNNSSIESIQSKAWHVYPNPVQTILNLATESNIGCVKIFNCNGQLIHDATYNDVSTQIDVSTWPAGIYLLRREDTGQVFKFIKQ